MRQAKTQLSKREEEVVNLAAQGYLDKEIVVRLGITENTLKTYWRRIRTKLGEGPRPGLVAEFLRQQAHEAEAKDIPFEADWIYDYRTQIWTQSSERPMPANIEISEPIPLDEILSYFHPEDADGLRQLVNQLATNDVEDFFFRARIMVATGFVQTSTFVHVIRDSRGQPVTLLGHRSKFHDLAPLPVRDLMVGYWEQDIATGEFTADVNLLFVFSKTGEGASIRETKYSRIPPAELKEIRQLVDRIISKKKTHLRTSHRLDSGSLPFRWATIDALVEYDAAGNGSRAHGSVLAFN
ncbi:MAG: LuxR C-terminal-related transcriptional regulator [Fimbriimonas sp.]